MNRCVRAAAATAARRTPCEHRAVRHASTRVDPLLLRVVCVCVCWTDMLSNLTDRFAVNVPRYWFSVQQLARKLQPKQMTCTRTCLCMCCMFAAKTPTHNKTPGKGGGGKGAMSFGKSKARMMSEEQIKTTFADVAGWYIWFFHEFCWTSPGWKFFSTDPFRFVKKEIWSLAGSIC